MSSEYTTVSKELGWDDIISQDSKPFVLLKKGDYPFTVVRMERGRFGGSAKLPPCLMATLTIRVYGEDNEIELTHRLYLHSVVEGLLCAFFESIGQRRHGESLRPRWNEVPGSSGMCRVGVREYIKKDGTMGEANQIERFLPPAAPTAAAPGGWQAGNF